MKAGWVRVVRHWGVVGYLAVWLVIALLLFGVRDSHDLAARLQRDRVHDNSAQISALKVEIAREHADVALLCESSQANRQVIRDLLAVGGGARALASVDTTKIRASEPYLANLIDLLVIQMRAANAAATHIIGRAIPCAGG